MLGHALTDGTHTQSTRKLHQYQYRARQPIVVFPFFSGSAVTCSAWKSHAPPQKAVVSAPPASLYT